MPGPKVVVLEVHACIVTSRYGLGETVDAIAKSIERADGKILVKPNWDSDDGDDGRPARASE